ncbi:MAG: glycosyltransferase [Candidatus Methylacidiphilales bacterium]|nr:glycosyltransferase [Candidatus Methylacidiphilales bacterium]
MIYLDVTSSCKTVLNTGVKRMQRGLHAWLGQGSDYRPVCWQSVRRNYRSLTKEDLAILEQVGDRKARGWESIDAYGGPSLTDIWHLNRDRQLAMDFPRELRSGDILLVPDMLWDSRGTFFSGLEACPAQMVGVFHDAIPLKRSTKSAIDSFLCRRGIRFLSHFDLVVCVSREAEEDLHFYWKQMGIKPTRTHAALWPVPFGGRQPEHRPAFPAKSLLTVARLQAYKNQLALLDACERLWNQGLDFRLRLIGCNSYPGYVWKVRRKIASLRAAGRDVQLRSQVTERELHEAYASCSFTVFPSLHEGFGLPVVESLWHGRPVVCSDQGAIGEAARGGGCQPMNPGDTGSMVEAIGRLLTDEGHYLKLYREIQARTFRHWPDYWQDVSSAIRELPSKGRGM